jgi:hypothetical protein
MPEGAETINGYNSHVDITEKFGWWSFAKTATEWRGITDGNSTIYKTELSANITPGTTKDVWFNILSIENVPPGRYKLDFLMTGVNLRCNTATYIYSYYGIGTANNNADIRYVFTYFGGSSLQRQSPITTMEIDYTVTATKTLYLNMLFATDLASATSNTIVVDAGLEACFLRAWRIA